MDGHLDHPMARGLVTDYAYMREQMTPCLTGKTVVITFSGARKLVVRIL